MRTSHLDHPDAFGVIPLFKRQHIDPMGVVNDTRMSTQEKREILADWASDRRTVVDHPALRRLDTGAIVDIDTILDALKRLDSPNVTIAGYSQSNQPPDRQGKRRSWSFWENDDDDDPPPCPAAAKPWKPRPMLDATRGIMVA